jgi:hypothetical protein
MLGVIAPAAPALGETVIAAGLFLAWVVAFGLLWVYRSTLGAIALALADRIEGVSVHTRLGAIHPFGAFADAIRWVDGEIDDGLGWAVQNTHRGAAILFQLARRQLMAIGDQVGGLAYDVSERFHHVTTREIPQVAGIAVKPVRISLDKTRTLVRATAATVAIDIPALHREVADWKGYTRRIARRLRRAEKLLAPAAFATAVVAAFARLGIGVLRCPRFLKAAKKTCSMDPTLLESMLLDTTLILSLLSLRQFAEEVGEITGDVSSVIHHLIRETK